MRTLARLLPLVLVAALAGCGQAPTSANDFKGADKAVAQTIEDLQSNAQIRKPSAICRDVLSTALADKLKSTGSDCAGEIEKLTGDADDFELEVTAITVSGSTATAKVKARRGDKKNASTTFSLVREDGDWRLSDLGAS
jgi:Putative lumazine-binding